MKLKNSQVEFIETDLRDRGILFDPLREDLVDHICCEVEKQMEEGVTFVNAYHQAIAPLRSRGLPQLNQEMTTALNSFTMIRSYLTITFRNIFRHKVFSAINIVGLSLGMAACFVILQYVTYELSFDRFQPFSDRIYRITDNAAREGGESFHTATTFLPVARLAKDDFSEVEDYSRLYFLDRHAIVSFEERKFEQEAVIYADANFFQFFSYRLITGEPAEVLASVNTVAISESAARKYFDRNDPVGKIIKLSEEFHDLTLLVTGVFNDPPANSHLRPQMVVSLASYENQPDVKSNEWTWPIYMNYVRLHNGSDPRTLEVKLESFVSLHFPRKDGSKHTLTLQPLEDIHLYSSLEYEIETNGNAQLVFLLLGVAILTLVIAYANYINLSTARSLDRAREVGIRKALGSNRTNLVRQFLAEAMVLNFIALVLAFAMVRMFTMLFLEFAGIENDFTLFSGPLFWGALGVLFILGAFLSSLYPALVLSSPQPIAVLRGGLSKSLSGQSSRRMLVLFQFAISMSLLMATYAIYSQMRYMRNHPLGMDIHQLLVVNAPRITSSLKAGAADDAFMLSIASNQLATHTCVSNSVPGFWTSRSSDITRYGSDEGKNNSYNVMRVDEGFINTYKLKVVAGRNFRPGVDTTSFSGAIINESAAGHLGFSSSEEAVNSKIQFRGRTVEVIGVIGDYHHYSLKARIDPLLIFPVGDRPIEFYTIRVNSIGIAETLTAIEAQWKAVYPDNPFQYFFLDSAFDAQYKSEEQFEKIFTAFSLMAVGIACLGLYGLASFVTMKRMKEIGIRKILGSSVKGIVALLLSDFSKLILIAGLVAVPFAYVGIQQWQSQFAFRDEMTWRMYAFPIGIVLLVAVLTIGFQTLKAALTNPVEVLKYE